MNRGGFSNLNSRLLIGSSLVVAIMTVIAALPNPVASALYLTGLGALVLTALNEFYLLCTKEGARPLFRLGAVYCIGTLANRYAGWNLDGPLLGAFLALLATHYLFRDEHPLRNMAYTGFGVLYVVFPLSLFVDLAFHPTSINPRACLILLLLATKGADTVAYFVGRAFGKRPLAPQISPKKTWEGAWAALVSGSVLAWGWMVLTPAVFHSPAPFTPWEAALLGGLLAAAGQVGDLIESNFKRDVAVKDSNNLPGLGGCLDMLDSLILATPLLYFYQQMR